MGLFIGARVVRGIDWHWGDQDGNFIVISQLPNKFRGHFATPLEYVIFVDLLISWVRLFAESYLSDTDNIAPFENTTPINVISLLCILFIWINLSSIFKRYINDTQFV